MKYLYLFPFLAFCASGAVPATTLMPPSSVVSPGAFVQLDFVSLNPGLTEVPFVAPASLTGTLETGHGSWPVTLEGATSAPLTVAAGGFGVRHYRVRIPEGLQGRAVLVVETPESGLLHAVLEVRTAAGGPGHETPPPLERLATATPAVSAIARNFAGRFLPNQPVYFLYGDSDQAAKFQFSFDYRLATLFRGEGDTRGTGTVRLGYTQRSVWDIDGASSPFYDTSYLPELAYSHDMPLPAQISPWFTWLGWRAGLQHESNGKEGADSRSLDTFYVRPRFVLGTLGKWAFVMLPEFQVYLGESGGNPDIDEYRGHGKLKFYFGHNQGPTLMVSAWAGKDFEHGTWQLDLAIPTRLRWLSLESYFYVQYFNGYGESLRDYRLRSDAVRAGISLVR